MRIAPAVMLTAEQREQLEANVRGRSLPARLVERSRIVLLAADGARDSDIAVALDITPHKAARWRSRFLELGLAGLEKDAARPGRPVLISTAKIQAVVTKTTQELPPNATPGGAHNAADLNASVLHAMSTPALADRQIIASVRNYVSPEEWGNAG